MNRYRVAIGSRALGEVHFVWIGERAADAVVECVARAVRGPFVECPDLFLLSQPLMVRVDLDPQTGKLESGGSRTAAAEASPSSSSAEIAPAPPDLTKGGGGEDDAADRCTDPGGHVWHEGEPDRAGEGPIRCIHCGADGDA